MKTRVIAGAAGLATAAIIVGQLAADDSGRRTDLSDRVEQSDPETYGGTPDVVVWSIQGDANWSSGDYRAYSTGTTSCNIGTAPLSWISNTNQHPVIAQNLFRWKEDGDGHGRFEQLGQGWLKHGFCALDLNACGSCQGTGCSSLGVGCSDPYTASRNGSQGPAGPKYQVNASSGFFNYPPADPPYSGATARRLRAHVDDVMAANNPGARYFFEAQYVHPQDSPQDAGNSWNNSSWREGNMGSNGTLNGYIGSTNVSQVAPYAWRTVDPQVQVRRYVIEDEGTFYVAYRTWDNGDGTWDYEYLLMNQDSDRSAGEFAVPVPAGVNITNVDFHDVDYHSSDGLDGDYDGTDWAATVGSGEIRWSVAAPHSVDDNGNALRWGTAYNFRFTADTAPESGNTVSLEYFKPGTPDGETLSNISTPSTPPVDCISDLDGDDMVAFSDLLVVLASWGSCPGCPADLDGDDMVGFADLLILLASWGPC